MGTVPITTPQIWLRSVLTAIDLKHFLLENGVSEKTVDSKGDLALLLMCATCNIFGVSAERLLSSDRGDATLARWALSYVLIERVGWSASRVGRLLSKHHTAIAYGHRRASDMRDNDEQFFNALCMIEDQI